ncbi:MAG: PAS domain S-box protein [Actinoplanes sp.]
MTHFRGFLVAVASVPRAAALVATVVGVTVAIGYAVGAEFLVAMLPGWPPMTKPSALFVICAGVALWLVAPLHARPRRRRAGTALAGMVALGGFWLLIMAATGSHLQSAGAGGDPHTHFGFAVVGTAPVRVALAFLMIGSALLLVDVDVPHGRRPTQVLAAAAALLIGVTALASIVGVESIAHDTQAHVMPLLTEVSLMALAIGVVTCRPDGLAVEIFTSSSLGGRTVRRLAPTVGGVVILIGIVMAFIVHTRQAIDGLVVTLAITSLLVTLYLVLLGLGRMLDMAEGRQADLIGELRDQRDFGEAVLTSLIEGVLAMAPDGTVLRVNSRWCQITGYDAGEVIGLRPPYPWWPSAGLAERWRDFQSAVTDPAVTEYHVEVCRKDGVRVPVLGTVRHVQTADARTRMVVVTYRDLTERDQQEAERRRMAQQLDHLFTMSQDLLCIAGVNGYFQRVNPAWERTLGYSESELVGRPFIDFVHPDDRARTLAEADKLAGGTAASVDFENRYRAHDGSYRWLHWSAAPADDEGMIYAIVRDNTERRQADEAAARLTAIVESTADSIICTTADGIIMSWNPAAERIYGYSADEMIGQDISILFPPERRHEVKSMVIEALAQGGTVRDHDAIRVRRDGGIVHLALTVSPLCDSEGNITGAASIGHDITDSKRAEQQFRQLVLSAPDAMVLYDADGIIRLVNEQTERMFRYASDELIGQKIEVLVPERHREKHVQERQQYLDRPTLRTMGHGHELLGRRRDGSQFSVEVNLAPLETEEGFLVSAAIRDTSERKKVEEALAAARDEAIAAAELKSQFVAMVSHEIRTPMNGVIGLTKLLLNTTLQPVQRRYSEAIHTSARALLTIINDILDFSKIEAGKITIVDNDFDIGKLVEEVAQAAAAAAREKDVEIVAYYPPELPRIVRGDEGRIRQVLLNLAGNAVKFTSSGHVLIRCDAASIASDGERDYTFTVSDTGIGIDQGQLARLFDPFTQADGTTSRQFGGTGLGLSISRQLVELMGAEMHVDSALGQGSAFGFTLGLAEPRHTFQEHRRLRDELSQTRLLLIDGNLTSRKFLCEHVTSWGMNAATAGTTKQALEAVFAAADQHKPFDIVIVDDHLPEVDGEAVLATVHNDAGIPTPACLLLSKDPSGSHYSDDIDHVEVFTKPIGPSALYNYLLRQLDVPQQASVRMSDSPAMSRPRKRVLLAEDNEINQLVAVDTLDSLGYDADVARNGAEAVQLAAQRPYEAILMDCQMPKLDGYEATSQVRSHEAGDRHVPIIAMTAGALQEDRQRALRAGMDDFLAKPIDPDELRATLDRWTTPAASSSE